MLLLVHAAAGQDFNIADVQEEIDHHRVLKLTTYGQIPEVLNLEWLPRDFVYPKGQVSVVPDKKDRLDGRVVVYLINDTDEPLKEGLSTGRVCHQEVMMDGRWNRSSPVALGCGTGMVFKSEDLPPRHAAIFIENDPAVGDLSGTMRYYVNIQGSKAIASAPFEGRFRSQEYEEAADGFDNPARHFLDDIPLASKASYWNEGEASKRREELVAALELQRHYDADWSIRQKASRWADILGKEGADEACRDAVREALSKPWKCHRDEAALFRRCREALSADGGKDWPYGSPERCKQAVWRYLAGLGRSDERRLANPERMTKLEAIKASGNPWGVPQKDAAELAVLAAARVKSSSQEGQSAAGYFLQRTYLGESGLSDEMVLGLLEFDSPIARRTAVAMLVNRGKDDVASAWLEKREVR